MISISFGSPKKVQMFFPIRRDPRFPLNVVPQMMRSLHLLLSHGGSSSTKRLPIMQESSPTGQEKIVFSIYQNSTLAAVSFQTPLSTSMPSRVSKVTLN